jgi:hypothetical protein
MASHRFIRCGLKLFGVGLLLALTPQWVLANAPLRVREEEPFPELPPTVKVRRWWYGRAHRKTPAAC